MQWIDAHSKIMIYNFVGRKPNLWDVVAENLTRAQGGLFPGLAVTLRLFAVGSISFSTLFGRVGVNDTIDYGSFEQLAHMSTENKGPF